MIALTSVITTCTTLNTLRLASFQLTPPLVAVLSVSLSSSSSLLHLDLSHNRLEDEGTISLSSSLLCLPQLQTLNLSWNQIRSRGAISLFSSLEQAVVVGKDRGIKVDLKELDLSWNSMGSGNSSSSSKSGGSKSSKSGSGSGAVEDILGHYLSTNTSLTHLDLSHNQLTSTQCGRLGDLLVDNHTLYGLHIEGNQGTNNTYGELKGDSNPWPVDTPHTHLQGGGSGSGSNSKIHHIKALHTCYGGGSIDSMTATNISPRIDDSGSGGSSTCLLYTSPSPRD